MNDVQAYEWPIDRNTVFDSQATPLSHKGTRRRDYERTAADIEISSRMSRMMCVFMLTVVYAHNGYFMLLLCPPPSLPSNLQGVPNCNQNSQNNDTRHKVLMEHLMIPRPLDANVASNNYKKR